MSRLAIALLLLPAAAWAEPDFIGPHPPPSAVPRSLAASSGTAPIDPLDIVAFELGSHALSSTAQIQLDNAASWLTHHREYRLVIEGHTDRLGTRTSNDELGLGRGERVRAYLMARGVEADRLVVVVYGESDACPCVNPNDRRAVIYASPLPVRSLVTRSLANPNVHVAVWTNRGTLFSESWNAPQVSRR